jgi:hypothetical protein
MSGSPPSVEQVLSAVHLFPVRHHSPRTSHALKRFLDQVKPALVLVEGPNDADTAIDVMLDAETKPPIAILGYRTDGEPGSSLFPFASYSPEYVALKWAKENGAQSRFIDISTGQGLEAIGSRVTRGAPRATRAERVRAARAGPWLSQLRGAVGGLLRGSEVRAGLVSRAAAGVGRRDSGRAVSAHVSPGP